MYNITTNDLIKKLGKRYSLDFFGLNEFIQSLESKYNVTLHKDIETSKDIIDVNKDYINMLLFKLKNIKGKLGDMEYKRCETGFSKVFDDSDEAEEIMLEVHEIIRKNIYESDTKVSLSDWNYLEKFLVEVGYVPVNVKSGDEVQPFRSCFERPIPAKGGIPGTIKQIQLQPYTIKFYDGDEIQELKLCGKCTYYK